MSREHRSFQGVMRAASVSQGKERTRAGDFKIPVEARIIRGDEPGELSIILPYPSEWIRETGRRRWFSWIYTYQINGVRTDELVDALEALGGLKKLKDGSYKAVARPLRAGESRFSGVMRGDTRNPATRDWWHNVEARMLATDVVGEVILQLPNPDMYMQQTGLGAAYDWRGSCLIERVSIQGLTDALLGLGLLEKAGNEAFNIAANPPVR